MIHIKLSNMKGLVGESDAESLIFGPYTDAVVGNGMLGGKLPNKSIDIVAVYVHDAWTTQDGKTWDGVTVTCS